MTKSLTCTLLAAFCLGGLSSAPALAASPAAEAAIPGDHVGLLDATLVCFDEMVAVLDKVKDKASADAAAAELAPLCARLKSYAAKGEELGEPSPEVLARLTAMKPALEACLSALMSKLMPLAMNNFYGSTALQQALESLN